MSIPYPKTEELTYWFKNWYVGMSNIDSDEYALPWQGSYVQSAGIWEEQPFLRPQRVNTANSGLISGNRLGKVRGYAAYNGKAYAVDHYDAAGTGTQDIYEATLTSPTAWTSVNSDTSLDIDTEPPAGVFIQQGLLYYFEEGVAENSNSVISRYNIATDTLTVTYDDLDVAAWGNVSNDIGGYLQHTDGITYLWKGRYIGPCDGTTLPSAVTPSAAPSGYVIRDAITYGNKILVIANQVKNQGIATNLADGLFGGSALFLYDPYAPGLLYTFDDWYKIQIPNVQGMRLVGGRVLIINADFDINIWEWLGSDVVKKVATIPVNYYDSTYFGVRWNSITQTANKLLFGTTSYNGQIPTSGDRYLRHGIYAYGYEKEGQSWALQNFIVPATGSNSTNLDLTEVDFRAVSLITADGAGSLFGLGGSIQYLYNTWYDTDATAYRNGVLQLGNTSYSADCAWESTWVRPIPGRKTIPLKMQLKGAAGTIIVKQMVDDDSGFTTIDTISSYTDEEAELAMNSIANPLTANFLTGHRHKFRFELNSASTTKLEKVKLQFRSNQQER